MTTTEQVSPNLAESTRKTGASIHSEILQRLATVTQARAADCMGVSASTVSRLVSEDLEKFGLFLSSLGLKVCPADAVIVSQDELRLYKTGLYRYLGAELEKDRIQSMKGA